MVSLSIILTESSPGSTIIIKQRKIIFILPTAIVLIRRKSIVCFDETKNESTCTHRFATFKSNWSDWTVAKIFFSFSAAYPLIYQIPARTDKLFYIKIANKVSHRWILFALYVPNNINLYRHIFIGKCFGSLNCELANSGT